MDVNINKISRIAERPQSPKSAGFTLIEIVLYVAIASVIFGGIAAFMDISLKSRVRQDVIGEVEYGGNAAMSAIAQAIRNAKSITLPVASSTGATLTLVMPDANISPTVFDLTSGGIRMSERGLGTTTITSSRLTASSLLFANLSRIGTPGAVRFQFVLDYANPDGIAEYTFRDHFIGGASLRPN